MHLSSSVLFALEALALVSFLPPSTFAYSHTLEVFLSDFKVSLVSFTLSPSTHLSYYLALVLMAK